MSNKLHENDHSSPENQQDEEQPVNNSVIGVSESTLKLIVIVLGVLLFFGFVAVVGTIVYRIVNLDADEVEQAQINQEQAYDISLTQNTVAFGNIEITKPSGNQLKSFQVDNGMVYLHFENSLGFETIKIVRLSDGMVMGNVNLVGEQ